MMDYENLKKSQEAILPLILEASERVIRSGHYILGQELAAFEKKFAEFVQVPFSLGVANGLDALILSIKALQLPRGSEILVPSNTYIATILSILQNDCRPVLIEPDLRTYNMNPHLLESHITNKTKAIIVVHLYGQACEMDLIKNTADTFHLPIIEDCAQAHGSSFQKIPVGTWGTFGAFSFYPTKNLGALGDGGAITMKDEHSFQLLKALRNYGSLEKYHNIHIGTNSRLDEIQAAFLSIKLEYLNQLTLHKKILASLYQQHLDSQKFILPYTHKHADHVYHIYPIRHPQRDKLRQYLLDRGIKTEIHYPIPPHHQKALRSSFQHSSFPISEEIHQTILSLPLSYGHTTEDIFQVIDVMNRFD